MKWFNIICIVFCFSVLIFLLSQPIPDTISNDNDIVREYDAAVEVFNFNTEINFYSEEELLYTIKGDDFAIVEDPLRMYNPYGELIGTAGDDYHFIAQDTHLISYDDDEIIMEGKAILFGEEYDIILDDKIVATATFNYSNTKGEITDLSGNIIAEYTSQIMSEDFVVSVTSNNTLSDEVILLIFSSYYSDHRADSR